MCNHQCLQAQSTQPTHTGCHTAVCWMSGTEGGEETGNIAQDNVGCSVLIIHCEDLIEMGHEWTGDICLISQPWLYTLHSALSSSRHIRPIRTLLSCRGSEEAIGQTSNFIQTMSVLIWIYIHTVQCNELDHISHLSCHQLSSVVSRVWGRAPVIG